MSNKYKVKKVALKTRRLCRKAPVNKLQDFFGYADSRIVVSVSILNAILINLMKNQSANLYLNERSIINNTKVKLVLLRLIMYHTLFNMFIQEIFQERILFFVNDHPKCNIYFAITCKRLIKVFVY